MRRLLTFVSAALVSGTLFAGGLVTNTNQSATWVRMPSRNASIKADAVYYNPAGLMMMDNGFHFSLSNQTVFQKRTIESTYPYLNSGTYEGSVTAPFFPSIYAAFKMDRIAFSVGFLPIGGGGGATYEDGLPSFEMSQSDLVPSLEPLGAKDYRMDVYFEGNSLFLGFQGAVSYKLNDWISVAAGLRYVTAKNTYSGHLKNVELYMETESSPGWKKANEVMTGVANQYTNGAAQATTVRATTTALVNANAGGLTLAQAEGTYITNAERIQLEGALTAFGLPTTDVISVIDAGLGSTADILTQKAAGATANASLLVDQEAEVEQTGSGFAPFFSVNISPSENLNIAIKYEMATKLELTNKTAKDLTTGYLNGNMGTPITRFPDGAKIRNDMPAMLAVGAEIRFPLLSFNVGANYYFDKSADYGHYIDGTPQNSTDYLVPISNDKIIANNGLSIQAGAEINVTERLAASAGYSFANQGVNSLYQSDLTYGLSTHTVGAGGAFAFSDNVKLNLGVSYTKYMDDSVKINHYLGGVNLMPTETYKKNTLVFGVGLDFSF